MYLFIFIYKPSCLHKSIYIYTYIYCVQIHTNHIYLCIYLHKSQCPGCVTEDKYIYMYIYVKIPMCSVHNRGAAVGHGRK